MEMENVSKWQQPDKIAENSPIKPINWSIMQSIQKCQGLSHKGHLTSIYTCLKLKLKEVYFKGVEALIINERKFETLNGWISKVKNGGSYICKPSRKKMHLTPLELKYFSFCNLQILVMKINMKGIWKCQTFFK